MEDVVQPTVALVEGAGGGALRLLRDVLISDVRLFYEELSMATAQAHDVFIDCSDVGYLCGAAWQVLLSLKIELRGRSAELLLKNLSPNLQRASQVLGLDEQFCGEGHAALS
ncbi:MAG: STAS domain-containing protein [Deltaproteobacteria bacterium]|nr:STAS domain-containing protein [Deltaproteobacteria bacterium]